MRHMSFGEDITHVSDAGTHILLTLKTRGGLAGRQGPSAGQTSSWGPASSVPWSDGEEAPVRVRRMTYMTVCSTHQLWMHYPEDIRVTTPWIRENGNVGVP